MYAVTGYYTGGDTVKIEGKDLSLKVPYKVVVTFLEPLSREEGMVRAEEREIGLLDGKIKIEFKEDFEMTAKELVGMV